MASGPAASGRTAAGGCRIAPATCQTVPPGRSRRPVRGYREPTTPTASWRQGEADARPRHPRRAARRRHRRPAPPGRRRRRRGPHQRRREGRAAGRGGDRRRTAWWSRPASSTSTPTTTARSPGTRCSRPQLARRDHPGDGQLRRRLRPGRPRAPGVAHRADGGGRGHPRDAPSPTASTGPGRASRSTSTRSTGSRRRSTWPPRSPTARCAPT